jgi:hypothetical protein
MISVLRFNIFLLLVLSCSDEHLEPQEVGGLLPIWSHDFGNGLVGHMDIVFDDNNIYTTSEENEVDVLHCIDKYTGESRFIDENFAKSGFVPTNSVDIFYDNGIIATYSEQIFGYDTKSKNTVWSYDEGLIGQDFLNFNGNPAFTSNSAEYGKHATFSIIENNQKQVYYETSITGDSLVALLPTQDFSTMKDNVFLYLLESRGVQGSMQAFMVKVDSQSKLAVGTIDVPRIATEKPNSFAYRYTINSNGIVVCAVGDYLCGYSIEKDEFIWTQKVTQGAGWSGFIIEDGTVYCNSWGKNVYAIDLQTGNLLWEKPVSANGSKLGYRNGVLYMIGANGRMYILEASNGEILYEIIAPTYLDNSNDYFETDNMTVDKKAGLVYVCSYSTAYAYKAIR